MKYCQRCGCALVDEAAYCPYCRTECPPMYPNPEDKKSFGWGLLCFLFPLVGLILYLVWNKEYPQRAKSCGNGAIVGVCVSIVLTVLPYVLALVLTILVNIFGI